MKADRDRSYVNLTVRLPEKANRARRRLEHTYEKNTTQPLEYCFFSLEQAFIDKLTEEEHALYFDEDLDYQTLRAVWRRAKEEAVAREAENGTGEGKHPEAAE